MLAKSVFSALVLIVTLAACDSAEERAEKHYQQGLALVEEGDYDRAIIEFRNVFQLDGGHLEARYALAKVFLEEKQNYSGARQQFQRIIEQYPDEIEARVNLAELFFRAGSFEDFDQHTAQAADLAPEDPRVQALSIARRYRSSIESEDAPARREQAREAEELLETHSDNLILREIVLDNHLRENDLRAALEQIDWLLEKDADAQRHWNQRLAVLVQLEDYDAVETHLQEMVKRFDNTETKAMLIQYYMSREETDKAEAFLREQAAAAEGTASQIDLIRFLFQVRGEDVAWQELQAALAETPDNLELKMLEASIDFDAGRRDEAIRKLEAALESAESSEITRNMRVVLAQMLLRNGNEVGARARVEQVLAEDPSNPEALKLQAAWLIEADDTDGAIAGLRVALEGAPEDAEAMTLMAQAYNRAGRNELARDFLALAVEASGNAPVETIRYARLLIEQESYLPAEDILLAALRLAPQNLDLLTTLGQLYLNMDNLGRVEQVIRTLRDIDDPTAERAAIALEAEMINLQTGPEEALSFLEGLANDSESGLATKVALIRGRLGTGDTEGALQLAREMLENDPENESLKAITASVEAANGNLEVAEEMYRDLLANNAARPNIWLELIRVNTLQGNSEQSLALIEEGITANPENPNLLWAKASLLEQQNDIDGAIEIYSGLYEKNSSSAIIANNLASLLSTYRSSDAESLERAWIIARRLREADIPAFQDTYGWIIHLRGESEEALPYLQEAARGLPKDPIVQFHLAEVYAALDRPAEAIEAYRTALDVAGPLDKRPQIDKARAQLETLQSALEESGTDQ